VKTFHRLRHGTKRSISDSQPGVRRGARQKINKKNYSWKLASRKSRQKSQSSCKQSTAYNVFEKKTNTVFVISST